MIWRMLEFAAGAVLALVVLRDVFDTVVVPGRSYGSLHIARRLVKLTLPLWRRARPHPGLSTSFAPFALVAAFAVWMGLLALAFGLMAHAQAADFDPPLAGLGEALYVAGGALTTTGLSGTDPQGLGRLVVVLGGFCGLAVMTMAVTYLLEVQTSIAQRDAGILKLTTSAGQPPSALTLLERYAELEFLPTIAEALSDGRDWCAGVQQSHVAHPSLIYFRTTGTGAGWPAALGALMDLALIVELLLDAPQWRGAAVLLREEGGRMSEAIADLIGLDPPAESPSPDAARELARRLKAAGLPLRRHPDLTRFGELRARHASCIDTLAEHLGAQAAPLLPPTSR